MRKSIKTAVQQLVNLRDEYEDEMRDNPESSRFDRLDDECRAALDMILPRGTTFEQYIIDRLGSSSKN